MEKAKIDPEWLSRWIQPQHLAEEALEGYRSAFRSGPVPIIQIENFLSPDNAMRLYSFMSGEATYTENYGLIKKDGARVDRAAWLAAPDSQRLYRFSVLTSGFENFSANAFTYMAITEALKDERFRAFFQLISGLPLSGLASVAVHALKEGDFLRSHNDQLDGRRLAFIVYLNPKWKAGFGGGLNIVGRDDEALSLECRYNSLVLFDVDGHRSHCIGEIDSSAGEQPRLTLGGWYD